MSKLVSKKLADQDECPRCGEHGEICGYSRFTPVYLPARQDIEKMRCSVCGFRWNNHYQVVYHHSEWRHHDWEDDWDE